MYLLECMTIIRNQLRAKEELEANDIFDLKFGIDNLIKAGQRSMVAGWANAQPIVFPTPTLKLNSVNSSKFKQYWYFL